MKIYISADIEGVGGVARHEHSRVDGREYPLARRLMTNEVNAAIGGAFEAGAMDVTVSDSHNVGLNLLPEELDERARLVMGSPRTLSMMHGIDATYSAAFFVGYHAMGGTMDASIVHTFTGRIQEVRLNGIKVGEIGLNAALAGHFGVPVAFVAGDLAACREAEALLPGVRTLAVKEAIGAYAAICEHPARTCRAIHAAAMEAITNPPKVKPLVFSGEVELTVRCTTASGADRAGMIPRAERLDDLTVQYVGRDVIEAFKAFNTMSCLVELVPFI
ncbi:M55 family metallopeptidase [Desulfomicrobium sp. ZS1]|uniref:M55 family metallopeptidase n=1 Tax=Desulfomicrobium sp. ZS1 TaxID=2952228 RepID=UPI0020B435F4|nr:M55 family metallopeptidase [Desulfomicrobium sp. ZS1]UTF49766.1 M55 family metallopeptidase [Desulfomicrobium sp. ZS1]